MAWSSTSASSAAELADHVAHLWWVRWDLARPFTVETLPHPSVHLLFERGAPPSPGPAQPLRPSAGRRGQVIGVKFRPGAFQLLLGRSMATLTDRTVAASTLFGRAIAGVARRRGSGHRRGPVAIETAVRDQLRPLSPRAHRDPRSGRAPRRRPAAGPRRGLPPRAPASTRTLQRASCHAVGVTPKWVLQRYRLHEAAERCAGHAAEPRRAGRRARLRRSHFVRDFKATIGRPPGTYARAAAARA
jgi:hypothetical protein